ncbi:PRC-barrel domain-containing protein [Halomicroarcula sp. S1AR25-4]|uniref:PRC-barrel domain-containing protein n=1 Tax=Haloarcula sp. S1AR25-4 TaxID=2950538 RepID=UPI0028752193|nr:PRC-barrel domain-containing protein [Halomicroarcula sp. S1AR25-4]MDS0278093.1 PRC-barrel domain-containing protein [Halomicroarcula sp. S1AR25-4]
MSQVLANELADKRVLTTDGQEIGTLYSITADLDSGALDTLIVETDRHEVYGIESNANGRVSLPADTLKAISEHVVITPPE